MSSWEEFKSGNFNVYGRWSAIISGIFRRAHMEFTLTCNTLRISNFISVFPFALAGFGITGVIVILEIPFVTKWCPTGPRTQKMSEFFSNPIFKTALYAAFSAVMWLSILMAGTSILAAAIGLSFTTLAYGVAIIRKDPAAVPLKQPNVAKLAAKAAMSPSKPVKSAAV
ncbi:Golgi apparatus membrane protein tvp18 [Chytriomyces hyalinus]|nr:Golgi apparatus membrane protein tvp18 [Chytriomyces hyalinus]